MRHHPRLLFSLLIVLTCWLATIRPLLSSPPEVDEMSLRVRLSWGHRSNELQSFFIKLGTPAPCRRIENVSAYQLESDDEQGESSWATNAGAGDIDGIEFTLVCKAEKPQKIEDVHILWSDLIAQSDADTARRLLQDPAFFQDPRLLTVQMSPEGTRGFSVSVGQLLNHRSLWCPGLDTVVTAGEPFAPAEAYLREMEQGTNRRVLDEIHSQAEADYDRYASVWQDMGNPRYVNPQSRGPGHIVGLTWDSAIPKFGIDRGGGVWNDYGNPDHFRFWFSFGDIEQGIHDTWRGQQLEDGLPVLTTTFQRDGLQYEVEQFAYPLQGPPSERRGDIEMVLLQKVRIANSSAHRRRVAVSMAHRREFPRYPAFDWEVEQGEKEALIRESSLERGVFLIEGIDEPVEWSGVRDYQREQRRVDTTVFLDVPSKGAQEFVVKLPSSLVRPEDVPTLRQLDYAAARARTLKFWTQRLDQGAVFSVPERIVNQLYRASLWHALRLPRRHGGEGDDVAIDLPYSNFAYSQQGIPWPINQAVYVDYMLYDLRGYHELSREELLQMFRRAQNADGSIAGYANWLVYTPGMLYALSKHYLLSDDRAGFEQLLPYALKSFEWCLRGVRRSSARPHPVHGFGRWSPQ